MRIVSSVPTYSSRKLTATNLFTDVRSEDPYGAKILQLPWPLFPPVERAESLNAAMFAMMDTPVVGGAARRQTPPLPKFFRRAYNHLEGAGWLAVQGPEGKTGEFVQTRGVDCAAHR